MSPTLFLSRSHRGRTMLFFALAALAGAASAQALPGPGPFGPPLPSAEELATIPSLSATQQSELRKILAERADALDAAREKSRAALEAQRRRDRAEFERIETQSSDRIRALLGDDGFRRYAEWMQARRGLGRFDGPGGGHHDRGGPHEGGSGAGPGAGPGPAPQPPHDAASR
ncbi:MAG TPA: hypothetical protein VGC30_07205 [Dokdonella sp.]